MKRYLRDYAILLPIAGIIIGLDQWTKFLVRETLPIGGTWMPWEWLSPYARIVHWYNTGAAFGIFQSGGMVFTALAIIVSILILFYFPSTSRKDWPLRVALGMQLGGAVGNLIDRLTIGQVTDFISIASFPVFNIADGSITIGVAVLILGAWMQERSEAAARRARQEQSQGEISQIQESTSGNDEARSG